MPSVTLQAAQSAAINYQTPTTNYSTGTQVTLNYYELLVSFGQMPASYQYKKITSVACYLYVASVNSGSTILAYPIDSQFVENAVTYNTRPNQDRIHFDSSYITTTGWKNLSILAVNYWSQIAKVFKNGIKYTALGLTVQTSRGSNKPYIVVTYEDTDIAPVLTGASPSSGCIQKGQPNTFSWGLDKSGNCYGDFTQSAATFRWRTGAGATEHEISCGTTMSCTVPANTFTSASIQWQVSVTTNTGATVTSDWYTLSCSDATSSAQIINPVDTIIVGSKAVRVSWNHIISSGTTPTGFCLQKSTDGSTWADVASNTNTSATHYDIPANTLAGGTVYLRVKTYNADGVAGTFSASVQNTVIAGPNAPAVTVTASPRPTVNWQAAGQQGYEVKIDGVSGGTVYGVATSYKWPDYLTDGQHMAAVRVQNSYGLWSEWTEAAFTVTHTEGSAITLTATATHFATLSWTTAGSYDSYIVYRNGKKIAVVTSTVFRDNLSIGTCSYQVRGVHTDDDDYGLSASADATVTADTLMICDVDAGTWMGLRLSTQSDRSMAQTLGLDVHYTYFAGCKYPSAEVSVRHSQKYAFDAAFSSAASAAAFEAMLGKTVCVKDSWGDMIIGILDGINISSNMYCKAYSCTVQGINRP